MDESSRERWAGFDPASIPTKHDLSQLEGFLESLRHRGLEGRRWLDLGCGTGGASAWLLEAGLQVVGVDINPEAVAYARQTASGARFHVRDIASPEGLDLDEAPFDAVVCQLVISVAGDLEARRALVANAFEWLKPGGSLYLSASGLSHEINPDYARRYRLDFPAIGERGTYFSRDADGNILYTTHHFEVEELRKLLVSVGFAEVSIARRRETSSRRPGEAAYFLYARSRRPPA